MEKDTLIDHLGRVCEKTEHYFKKFNNISLDNIDKETKESFEQLKIFLEADKLQILFFSIIFKNSISGWGADIEFIARHLGTEPFQIVKYYESLRKMVRRGIISSSKRHSDQAFKITDKVFDAILKNEVSVKSNISDLDFFDFIEIYSNLFLEKSNSEISENDFIERVDELIDANLHLAICKEIKSLGLTKYEKILVFAICIEIINDSNSIDIDYIIGNVTSSIASKSKLRKSLILKNTILQQKELIKFVEDGFFQIGRSLGFTDEGIERFLPEFTIKPKSFESTKFSIFNPQNIAAKLLIFDGELNSQVNELKNILSPDNFDKIQGRLRDKNMPTGFCCVFFGMAGTGKTESVFQIAKKTNRTLLMVDLSKTKDKYVGESEKRIQDIFNSYNKALKYYKNAPILLFNEADSIIGSRISVSNSVDQMNNSIQNILLQNMEDFKGIMIATTNMVGNFDTAFERRFIYKIKFNIPSVQVRTEIWKEKLPILNNNEALTLAENFNLSGSQIENIAKKCELKFILEDVKTDIHLLEKLASQECFYNINRENRIGYKVVA